MYSIYTNINFDSDNDAVNSNRCHMKIHCCRVADGDCTKPHRCLETCHRVDGKKGVQDLLRGLFRLF